MIRPPEVTMQVSGPTFFAMGTPRGSRRKSKDGFWGSLGDSALDPVQVPMLEALRWIDEPLSAIGLVDVLDGYLTMWEAKYHLEGLETASMVKPTSADGSSEPVSDFDLPYRLSTAVSDND
jgi:hypothetical protein